MVDKDELQIILEAMKSGKRNSAADVERLKQIQTLVAALLSDEEQEPDEGMMGGKAIGKRDDVNPKEGEHQYGDVKFADEKNKKYPIDTEEHIRAAWNYINKDANAGKYSADEVQLIKSHIVAAWKEKIDKAGPPSAKSLDLSYAKSLGIAVPDLAVKHVSADEIHGYTMIWGNPDKIDVEREFFTAETNFWDQVYGKSSRPLTWDHAQDPTMKADTQIGTINDFGDDEIGRWYTATLDRAHRYRKAIDGLIEQGALGTSSDSVLQYIQRQKTKSGATWLAVWPWVGSALTTTPAEPRLLASVEYAKSIGFTLPTPEALEQEQARARQATLVAKRNRLNLSL